MKVVMSRDRGRKVVMPCARVATDMPQSAMADLSSYEQPSPKRRSWKHGLDPKQNATAREEARRESRQAAATERAVELSRGQSDAPVPPATDPVFVCGRIACKRSIATIAREIGCGEDKLAAWLLHPDRRDLYNSALLGFAHNCATETIEIADNLTLDPADKKVMIDARWAAAKTMGREFYADKVSVQADVRIQHVVDSSMLTGDQRDQLRGILQAAIEQARDQGRVIEHENGEE